MARTAELCCPDIVFMADGCSTEDDGLAPEALRGMGTLVHFDPLTLLGVLSTVTSRIGLVCTGPTTCNEPCDWARRLASLDHMSGGRARWNVITSQMTSEPLNFGYDGQLSHAASGFVPGLGLGVGAAILLVLSPAAGRGLLPPAIVLRSVPLVAMTPLIVLVSGRAAVAVIGGLIVSCPTLVTTVQGLRSAPRSCADLIRMHGGGFVILRKACSAPTPSSPLPGQR